VARIGSTLDVRWPRRGAVCEVEIERFLAPQLRHHVTAAEQLPNNSEVSDWIKETYVALLQMTVSPKHEASIARLDRIRNEFEKAAKEFGAALVEGEMELETWKVQNSHLLATREALQQRISILSNEQRRERTSAEAVESKQKEELESALTLLALERQKVTEYADRLSALEESRRSAEATHAAAANEAVRVSSEHEALKRHISSISDEQRRDRADAEAEAARLKEELESALTLLALERQKVTEYADRLSALEESRRSAEATHAAAANEAVRVSSEHEALKRHISSISDEQRRDRADAEAEAARLKEELESALTLLALERQKVTEYADRLSALEESRRSAEATHAAAANEAVRVSSEHEALKRHISSISDEQRRDRADAEAEAARLKEELNNTLTLLS